MTPSEIARGLTKAQQKWLPSFGPEWIRWWPVGMSNRTRLSLIQLGLVEQSATTGNFQLVGHRLTPLGLAVRDHLQKEAGE